MTRIESENPDYLLYSIHLALRGYLQNISYKSLESDYGEAFSRYYSKFLSDTYSERGKENHVPSTTRFKIIAESEYSDFDRAIELAKSQQVVADISRCLGLIFSNDGNGILTKSLTIDEELNERVGIARDYTSIGIVLRNIGNYQDALQSYNKAVKIHEELNDRVRMARDYSSIGDVLRKMDKPREALYIHNKAVKIHEELNDRVRMARCYMGIALVLREMGKSQEALDSYNKALMQVI